MKRVTLLKIEKETTSVPQGQQYIEYWKSDLDWRSLVFDGKGIIEDTEHTRTMYLPVVEVMSGYTKIDQETRERLDIVDTEYIAVDSTLQKYMDAITNEKQYALEHQIRETAKLSKELATLSNKVNKANFWRRFKYLFKGEI